MSSAACPTCGLTGIHACPGPPIHPTWLQELNDRAAEIERLTDELDSVRRQLSMSLRTNARLRARATR